jgi:hypothetical protein
MKIYPGTEYAAARKLESPIFQGIETLFYSYLDRETERGSDTEEMYTGPEAIYSPKGAIRQILAAAIDEADETGQPVEIEVQFIQEALS